MTLRERVRPGGRSARIQASVHEAVAHLLAHTDREALTVPQIASKAGVTPSTIYRRWGDLPGLLADVALERMRPDTGPRDTGSAHKDLLVWVAQYQDEIASNPGRDLIRDVLAASDDREPALMCGDITRAQLQVILDRAAKRGETLPMMDALMDGVVAPIVYRALFDSRPMAPDFGCRLVDALMRSRSAAARSRRPRDTPRS